MAENIHGLFTGVITSPKEVDEYGPYYNWWDLVPNHLDWDSSPFLLGWFEGEIFVLNVRRAKWCFLRSSKILIESASTSWMMSGDFLTISSVPTVKSQQKWVDFRCFPLHTEKKRSKKTPNKKKVTPPPTSPTSAPKKKSVQESKNTCRWLLWAPNFRC